jgi:hypothetical protein
MYTPSLSSSWIPMKPSSELVFFEFAQPCISDTSIGYVRILAFDGWIIRSPSLLTFLVLAIRIVVAMNWVYAVGADIP